MQHYRPNAFKAHLSGHDEQQKTHESRGDAHAGGSEPLGDPVAEIHDDKADEDSGGHRRDGDGRARRLERVAGEAHDRGDRRRAGDHGDGERRERDVGGRQMVVLLAVRWMRYGRVDVVQHVETHLAEQYAAHDAEGRDANVEIGEQKAPCESDYEQKDQRDKGCLDCRLFSLLDVHRRRHRDEDGDEADRIGRRKERHE